MAKKGCNIDQINLKCKADFVYDNVSIFKRDFHAVVKNACVSKQIVTKIENCHNRHLDWGQ